MKITDICTPVDTRRGAPMGRYNVGSVPSCITSGRNNRICKKHQIKVYNKRVQLNDGYDCGGAYWGWPNNLYVAFTKTLSYVEFYRR